ncbi:MAG: outer membrane beta-barrel domain-containing protein [Desulfuromonas sp.]|uniref:OmpA family protein n=1 Tax=Desulfuromonas sp. TaxID=892 RepID=UPI000CA7F6D2|nr:OmpA family protein [Desulfuromonas sp.]PLX86489.1 MAG: outer membrane beta-barrel domain-containing protein [Desulfuromonas sp.]
MKTGPFANIILGIAIFALLAGPAFAENRAGALILTPSIGGYVFEGDQHLENDLAYGLGLGYNFTKHWGAEFVYNYVNTESEVGNLDDYEVYLGRINALYNFLPDEALVPFLSAGLGWTYLDPDTKGGKGDALFNYGGGLSYFLTENLALRGDVRHILTFIDESSHNLLYTGGLNYLLGGHQPAAQPIDSDGDGVIDPQDRCPDTPRGVMVDSRGCPADSDGDGVPDHLDKCPGTPRGAAVDQQGCPSDSDSDGDGVPDHLDNCPDTPKWQLVDKQGCPLKYTMHLEFDFDKAEIKPDHHVALEQAARFIRGNPSPHILVAGHTDNVGKAEYNQQLSEKRAAAVRQYLVENFGIDSSKLVARGFGETQPVADNNTEEGRDQNRRVEILCCALLPD